MTTTQQQREWFYLQQQRKRRRLAPAPVIEQRYFTTLTAAGGMYYSLAAPVTLTGDFEIEFDFYIKSSNPTSNGYRLLGFDGNDLIKIFDKGEFTVGNTVRLRSGGVNSDAEFDIEIGKFNKLLISRTGSSIYFKINNGVSVLGSAQISTNVLINKIGQTASTEYLDGIISNLTIKQSGTLTNSWALDSDGTTGAEIDSVGGNNATRVNMTAADTELFTLNTAATPDQWESTTSAKVIPIAGTL